MNILAMRPSQPILSRMKLFFGLSRTPHGLLDLATPAFAALLWYGGFPPPKVMILGFFTAFAGYTAVYALNDLVDYRADKERIDRMLLLAGGKDLDGVFIRHPVAQGLLSVRQALLWAIAWAAVALFGAYHLNPACAAIFLGGCLLETAYCALWKSACLKVLISGAVKTSGAMAAVYAVDPAPSPPFLLLLFLWLFFWEIGGQNIPNDWADLEEDRMVHATTIPLLFGPVLANGLILASLLLALILNGLLLGFLPPDIRFTGIAASLGAGLYLLLLPAYRLFRTKERGQALALFNRASYYPLAMLAVIVITIIAS